MSCRTCGGELDDDLLPVCEACISSMDSDELYALSEELHGEADELRDSAALLDDADPASLLDMLEAGSIGHEDLSRDQMLAVAEYCYEQADLLAEEIAELTGVESDDFEESDVDLYADDREDSVW